MMSHKSRNRTELSEDERERVEAFFEPYNRVRHKREGFFFLKNNCLPLQLPGNLCTHRDNF